ncbi:MAG: thioredoxin-dependent thiol peroxidase [Saprospiraceae bacterium]
MSVPDYKPQFKIQIGDTAVNFKTTIQDGSIIELNKIKSKWIVLFFYPEDNTPTCTKEACNLRDHFEIIKDCGAIIFGISPDTEAKHQKFISKFSLPYDLIADVNHEISSAYGVWGTKKFMGLVFDGIHRSTIIINENHKIQDIIYPVVSATHHEQILQSIQLK